MNEHSQDTIMGKDKVKPLEFTQAMVALELSETDEPVLTYFDFLTRQVPTAAAYFVHVLPPVEFVSEEAAREKYEINSDVTQRMRLKIKDRITDENSIYIEFDVRQGNPLEELLKDAEDVGADLVVIGQRSGVEHHGILAKNLVRKTKGDALIIPDQSQARLKKILVPIDFSNNSVRALQRACALNLKLDEPAEIICLNVFEMPNLSVYKIGRTPEQFKSMIEEDRKMAFDNFIRNYVPNNTDSIRTELVEKEIPGIGHYICDYAEQNDIDMIVIGARGHSKVELLLLGSVTEKVLSDNERIPTLVVK